MEGAIRRGIQWLLSMQNRDGGWARFDRDNDQKFLCNIPLRSQRDDRPSTADVTGAWSNASAVWLARGTSCDSARP